MSTLQIQLFGDFQIRFGDALLDGFDAPRLQSLLAFLLLHRSAPQSRKHVAFLLWQDSSEKQAHGNLRNLLHRLKKTLPDMERFIWSDAQSVQWRADSPYTLDVAEFQDLLTPDAESGATVNTSDRLAAAVALYRGDLLPACYDEWLLPERERLSEMYVDALAQLVAQSEAAHDYHAAIGYARRILQADPLGEETYRKLMSLYARIGDRANVVRVYQTCVAVLKRELDTEPGALTRETFEQLRRDDTPIERPAIPRGHPKPNLPVPLTSFIGRTRELGEISALLGRARLVTLTGVGGCGKTRLSIRAGQAATALFPDGVWFIDFAPLSDPADVPRVCATVLGLREQAGTDPVEMLAEFVSDKTLLLIFDNCEHLIAACASLAQALLQAAPHLRILATSREPLNLLGEALLFVPPLSLPDVPGATLESVAQSDAVQLFVARVSFVLPTFNLNQENVGTIGQICRRLDGIPLAIELAAARVRTLTPKQIAERLDDALAMLTRGSSGMPARHQTMRAMLDWSDALLSEPERIFFRRLSAFSGSFTLDAAEQVCTDGENESLKQKERKDKDHPLTPSLPLSLTPSLPHSLSPSLPHPISPSLVLDLLSNLIDKSLVTALDVAQSEEARYRLLEPIRQYAREKLQTVGEEETLAARHLAWCVELAEQLRPALEGAKQAAGLLRLEQEHDNLRGALEFALHTGRREPGLRLATALERFWFIGGHTIEGRSWFRQLRAEPSGDAADVNPALYARALAVAGLLAHRQNEFDYAEMCYAECLRVWQALDDRGGIALALKQWGDVARTRGEYERSVELSTQSLEIWRAQGDSKGVANALYSLGATLSEQGNYERASALYQEGIVIAQALGDLWLIAIFINNLGVAVRMQDPARAETLFRETLTIRRSLGDQYGTAISLRNLGEMALAQQEWVRARELFAESLALHESMDNAKGAAECFVGLAWVEVMEGDAARAARILGNSERLREIIRSPVPEDDRAEYDDLVSRVQAQLDAPTFESAWAEGRAMTLELAAAYALGPQK